MNTLEAAKIFEGFRPPKPHDWLKDNHAMKYLNHITIGFSLASFLATAARGDGFTPTSGMNDPRCNHTATRLLDGRVLVVAGRAADSGSTAGAKLCDPATGTRSPAGNTGTSGTATLLLNGKVLVAGSRPPFRGFFHVRMDLSESCQKKTGFWGVFTFCRNSRNP